jgi:hypothetical protein
VVAPADRPILGLAFISVVCDDCGRRRRLSRRRLLQLRMTSHYTLDDVSARLVCTGCRSQGGAGRNLLLYPVWAHTDPGGPPVNAELFAI